MADNEVKVIVTGALVCKVIICKDTTVVDIYRIISEALLRAEGFKMTPNGVKVIVPKRLAEARR